MRYTMQKLDELQFLGIIWYSFTEPFLNTENEMLRNIFLAISSSLAKVEREKISERVKAGLERRRLKGPIKPRGTDRKKRVRHYWKRPLSV